MTRMAERFERLKRAVSRQRARLPLFAHHLRGGALLAGDDFRSTLLAAFVYEPRMQTLEVRFRSGSVYRYLCVPPEVVEQLRSSSSKGRFFNNAIRGRYPFRRVGD